MAREAEVRKWLRNTWGRKLPGLTWIEAARGGTVGAPDVFVPIGDRLVPLELKYGRDLGGGRLETIVRPSQIAWHWGMNASGIATFLAIGVGIGKNFKVILVGGSMAKEPIKCGISVGVLDRDGLVGVLERAIKHDPTPLLF